MQHYKNCWRKTVHAWSHQVLKNTGESVCENEQMALLSYQAAISNAARGAICRLSEDLFNVMFAPGSSAQDLKAPCQRSATKQAPRMLLSQINVLSRYTHTHSHLYIKYNPRRGEMRYLCSRELFRSESRVGSAARPGAIRATCRALSRCKLRARESAA